MSDPRGKHPNSLKNLRPGPSAPAGNQYSSMAAQRRARIQQLCTMDARQLANLKGKTIYDDMIIRMLKSSHPKDHELIMKADAPGILQDNIKIETDEYTDEERIARIIAILDIARERRANETSE